MPPVLLAALLLSADAPKPLRVGIVGTDSSHAVAFTKLFHTGALAGEGLRVVAAYPGGSPDIESSRTRVQGYADTLRTEYGVEIVESVAALLPKVDAVMIHSVDGRAHLPQARPVIAAGKPLFVDKPVAASLADAAELFRLAAAAKVPCFSSSSLRFSPGIRAARADPKLGGVSGCDAFSPSPAEPHHPDLAWYGIHGVETLFTVMGPGCKSVTRVSGSDEMVVGVWADGRVGTFRGLKASKGAYGGTAFGPKGSVSLGGFGGYEPLAAEVAKFFRTGAPPVSAAETLEILAFIEAADESKRRGGRPVELAEVMPK